MPIRVPSRTKLRRYGYVTAGDGGNGGPLDVQCPTLIEPENDESILQELVTFEWGAVAGATSYNFYLWEVTTAEPSPVNLTALTYQQQLEFGKSYRWRVTAVNDFGESAGCTYGLPFALPPGKSGYNEFEVNQGYVSLEDDFYIVDDDAGSLSINVIRQGSTGAASVQYATTDGTAVAPGDYTDTSGIATWANAVDGAFPVSIPVEPLTLIEELATDYLIPWENGLDDPRADSGSYQYRYDSPDDPPTSWGTEAAAHTAAEAFEGYTLGALLIGWDNGDTAGLSPLDSVVAGEREELRLHYSKEGYIESVSQYFGLTEYEAAGPGNYTANPNFENLFDLGVSEGTKVWTYNRIGLRSFGGLSVTTTGGRPDADWVDLNNCLTVFGCPYTNGSQMFGLADTQISVRRAPQSPVIAGADFPDWEVCPDFYTQDPETLRIYSKAEYGKVFGSFRWLAKYEVVSGVVVHKPIGPVLEVGDPNDTEAFWTAARNAAVAAGTLDPSVVTYQANGNGAQTTYPRNETYAWYRSYKLPLRFTFGISNAVNANIIEPDTATIWIVGDC